MIVEVGARLTEALMAARVREAVHKEPLWRERATFIVAAPIEGGKSDIKTEHLWARKLSDFEFEICCIPFFVYDLALGDVVETDPDHLVEALVTPSGHYTFRVWLGHWLQPRDEIVTGLAERGALMEWSSENLMAADAAYQETAQSVADFLQSKQDQHQLIFETGQTK